MSCGAPVAGRDFVHVNNLVIVGVLFLCLLNQGAAQVAAKEVHVITKVWEMLEMGALPHSTHVGRCLCQKQIKKTPNTPKNQ